MTERIRTLAFAATGALVMAAAAAASVVGGSDNHPTPRAQAATPSRADPAPVIVNGRAPGGDEHDQAHEEPERDVGPPKPPTGRADRRRAERVARRFLQALDRHGRGATDRRTRRTLRATTSPRLASQLTGSPPRPTRGDAPAAELARLELHGPDRGEITAAALMDYRGGPTSLLDFTLRQTRGGWRVAELYPEG